MHAGNVGQGDGGARVGDDSVGGEIGFLQGDQVVGAVVDDGVAAVDLVAGGYGVVTAGEGDGITAEQGDLRRALGLQQPVQAAERKRAALHGE